ncbi:hypothetical protein Ancab_038722 [Ancistrocladus abbreviatus]
MKADNVKLYGKIRYVQDYNHEKVVSIGSRKQSEDLESGFSLDVESKYQKMKGIRGGLWDRITLSSGQFLLGNKDKELSHVPLAKSVLGVPLPPSAPSLIVHSLVASSLTPPITTPALRPTSSIPNPAITRSSTLNHLIYELELASCIDIPVEGDVADAKVEIDDYTVVKGGINDDA